MAYPTFGGFSLQDDNYITTEIEYRTWPTRNTKTDKIAYRPGAKLLDTEFGEKRIILRGFIKGSSESDLQSKMDDFHQNVSEKSQSLIIESGRTFTATASMVSISDPHYAVDIVPFELEFICADPFAYGSSRTVTMTVTSGVGSEDYTVTVSGSVFAEPSITYATVSGVSGSTFIVVLNVGSEIISSPHTGRGNKLYIFAEVFVMSTYKKKFVYKEYYSDTDIRPVWGDEIISEPTFRTTINSGPGELRVRLQRDFDAFGEGDDVELNRKIDLYVYDRDEPDGKLIYRGYISGYAPILNKGEQYIEITILGYIADARNRVLKDSNGYTALQYYSEDPSNIFKDIIDKYRADGGELKYTASSVDTTNTTVTYTFNVNTVEDALEKTIELAPYEWYFLIAPDSTCYLKERSSSADHKLYIGKHISYMSPARRLEDVVNRVYFIGGTPEGEEQLYRVYSSSSSISEWGLREIKKTDQRVTLTSTADTKANRILNDRSAPTIRTVLRVVDNNGEDENMGYDIESINPGDTISIENLKSSQKTLAYWGQATWDSSNWDYEISGLVSDILHVTSVTYHPTYIELEAARRLPEVPKRIEDISRNLDDTITSDLPTKPTAA